MLWKIKNKKRFVSLFKNKIWLEILILAVIFAGLFEISYYRRFYPNIMIGDAEIGGKSYDEVREKYISAYQKFKDDGIHIVFFRRDNSKEILVPMASSGLTSDTVVEYYTLEDPEPIVRKAFELGRRGGIFRRIKERLSLLSGRKIFLFSNSFQEEAVQSLIDRELTNFYDVPESAKFAFNSDGEIIIVPEKRGEELNNDGNRIIRLLAKTLLNFDSETLFFVPKLNQPKVTVEKLESVLNLVREISKTKRLEFIYGDYLWKLSGRDFVKWLTLKENGGLGVETAELEKFLKRTVTPVIYSPPENSKFELRGGKLVEIAQGRSGNSVDIEKIKNFLEAKLENTAASFTDAGEPPSLKREAITVSIGIVKVSPKITKKTLDQYAIKELVASVKTSFKGSSEGRKHNIKAGLARLNGLFIAPGEEFSAVEAIGLTREEDGFLKEFVIKGNQSVKESGGGLCQIATTLFRLAINAGLPITARTNHLYVVSYYGPGLDATVYGSQKDLKFINDTGHYLLLQAKVIGNEVLMDFYGQKDGREVTLSEVKISDKIPPPPPKYTFSSELKAGEEKCTEQARFGLTAEVGYSVRYPNSKINSQVFKSIYQPWQKVCLVGR